MTSTMIIGPGNPSSRPRNFMLKAGKAQVFEGPVAINNTGAGRATVLEVDGNDTTLPAAASELQPGGALVIPAGQLRRLVALDNAALWFVWG